MHDKKVKIKYLPSLHNETVLKKLKTVNLSSSPSWQLIIISSTNLPLVRSTIDPIKNMILLGSGDWKGAENCKRE